MFEPTIKYRKVNDPPKDNVKSPNEIISNTNLKKQDEPNADTTAEEPKPLDNPQAKKNKNDPTREEPTIDTSTPKEKPAVENPYAFTFEEEESEGASAIEVDPNDKERIIVTLSTGKQFSADRYCPHAGADLSYHGKLGEHDYPPEIGPVLMCPIHYWEFALEKGGRGGSGRTTINACPVEATEKCAASAEKKALEW